MTDREIMQQALDALEYHTMQTRPIFHTDEAIESLRQALAQPEQESPHSAKGSADSAERFGKPEQEPINKMPTKIFGPNLEQILNAAGFYRREWVGLTDDEVFEFLSCGVNGHEDINNIEEALRSKNGG